MRKLLKQNARLVSFFQNSHFWSGQLEAISKENHITRKMVTHGDTRWFTQSKQAMSVQDHR
jgi:hypothetical protein